MAEMNLRLETKADKSTVQQLSRDKAAIEDVTTLRSDLHKW